MDKAAIKHPDIKGWGIDTDLRNDPTYPLKDRNNAEHEGYTWKRPAQQPEAVEILHSIERPNVTAVFGTSVPPSGLSGKIRRFAFQYSENVYLHWLPLILADRVNEVEGIIEDLKRGYIPNIFAEKGGKAAWKFNRAAYVKKLAISGAVVAGIFALILRKK